MTKIDVKYQNSINSIKYVSEKQKQYAAYIICLCYPLVNDELKIILVKFLCITY